MLARPAPKAALRPYPGDRISDGERTCRGTLEVLTFGAPPPIGVGHAFGTRRGRGCLIASPFTGGAAFGFPARGATGRWSLTATGFTW